MVREIFRKMLSSNQMKKKNFKNHGIMQLDDNDDATITIWLSENINVIIHVLIWIDDNIDVLVI
jgi:hypothetical protein